MTTLKRFIFLPSIRNLIFVITFIRWLMYASSSAGIRKFSWGYFMICLYSKGALVHFLGWVLCLYWRQLFIPHLRAPTIFLHLVSHIIFISCKSKILLETKSIFSSNLSVSNWSNCYELSTCSHFSYKCSHQFGSYLLRLSFMEVILIFSWINLFPSLGVFLCF